MSDVPTTSETGTPQEASADAEPAASDALEAAAQRLTGKQRAFADAYVETLNQTEAARRAYDCGSDNAAAVQGHRSLRNAKVKEYLAEQSDLFAMHAAEVIMRLSYLGRTSAADFISFDDDGPYLDLSKAAKRNALGSVRSIKQTTIELNDEVVKRTLDVKLQDPRHALKALAKIMDLDGDEAAGGPSASEQVLQLVQQKIEQHTHIHS